MAERTRWQKFTPECDRLFTTSIVTPSLLVEQLRVAFPAWTAYFKPGPPTMLFRERWAMAHRVRFNNKLSIEQFPTEYRRRWNVYLSVVDQERLRVRDILTNLGQTVGGTSTSERNVIATLLPEDDRLFPGATVSPHRFVNRLLKAIGDVRAHVDPASMEYRGGTITVYKKRMYQYHFPIAVVHLPTADSPARFTTLEGTWTRRRQFYQHLAMTLFRMGEQRYPVGN